MCMHYMSICICTYIYIYTHIAPAQPEGQLSIDMKASDPSLASRLLEEAEAAFPSGGDDVEME